MLMPAISMLLQEEKTLQNLVMFKFKWSSKWLQGRWTSIFLWEYLHWDHWASCKRLLFRAKEQMFEYVPILIALESAEFLHVKPGKGAAFVRSKLKNYLSGAIQDKTFRAGESLQAAMVERRDSQFSYVDGDDVSTASLVSPMNADLLPLERIHKCPSDLSWMQRQVIRQIRLPCYTPYIVLKAQYQAHFDSISSCRWFSWTLVHMKNHVWNETTHGQDGWRKGMKWPWWCGMAKSSQ